MFTRLFDFLLVCLSLPLSLPFMLVIALLLRNNSPGPIFFLQDRVGLQGRTFKIYKFRTMVKDAEVMGDSVTTSKDPRITSFGRILRKTKLDELPQLINVFTGDMSVVGPRPDVPEIVANYTPEMRRVFNVRPGITSIATLHLYDEEKMLSVVDDPVEFYGKVLAPFKVKLAMEHIHHRSFCFHLIILCRTIWMLSFGRLWPLVEHPAIAELKKDILEDWKPKAEII